MPGRTLGLPLWQDPGFSVRLLQQHPQKVATVLLPLACVAQIAVVDLQRQSSAHLSAPHVLHSREVS